MQTRYQYGTLSIRKRKKGPDVWQFRYKDQINSRRKPVLIGTVERFPTKADAQRAVEYLRSKVNAACPESGFHRMTVGGLIDRFMTEYALKRCRKPTQRVYHSLFKNHIRPTWGSAFLDSIKPPAVEDWLEKMQASRQVKSHVRNLMHTLYQAAMRWELVERNPISLVRQSRKRLKIPRVLTPEEFKALLAELSKPYKTMVVTIACLGLRVCELLGLQWNDVDFENLTLKVQRSFVEGRIYPTKTAASEGTLPLDPDIAELLLTHRSRTSYRADTDFVFAGANGNPRWPDVMLTDHIKPAAAKAGIGKVGWHTFRRTYSTWLNALGTAPLVQKELLRHSDITTTLNIYAQAVTAQKREAATKIVGTLWKG